MDKYLLISIQPQHVANILNGDKTIELRKVVLNWVKEEVAKGNKVKFLIYCTKKYPFIEWYEWEDGSKSYYPEVRNIREWNINGKIVAEFEVSKIDIYPYDEDIILPNGYEDYDGSYRDTSEHFGEGYWITIGELKKTCVQEKEMIEYGNGKHLYGLHIDNLKIFNKPLELSEVSTRHLKKENLYLHVLYRWYYEKVSKAPKNMMTVWYDDNKTVVD